MTEPAIDVSVVICAYTEERWSELCDAIRSVQAQTQPPLEVIVAIDHNPALLERLRDMAGIRLIESAGPKGKSGALNTAIGVARGSVIALLDDDAAAEPTWLERLCASYGDSRVLGVGGHLKPVWSTVRPRWFPDEFLWVVGCTFRGMPTRRQPVRGLIGANMSFRKEVFARVGGSRPGMGPNGTQLVGAARAEDIEFCLRASALWPDRVWLYDPSARVKHHVPAARTTWSFFVSRCNTEGVSKAVLAQIAGGRRGLGHERRYTLMTLPSGVLLDIAEGILRLDPGGFARAGAIIVGFLATLTGYLRETIRLRRLAHDDGVTNEPTPAEPTTLTAEHS